MQLKRTIVSRMEDSSHQLSLNNLTEKTQADQDIPGQSITQRTTLKKSVTFASVFDSIVNEDDRTNHRETTTNKKAFSEENLLKSENGDQTKIDPESYPFRSKISDPSSQQTKEVKRVVKSRNSRRKFISLFIGHHRPKKLRHPVHTTDSIGTENRSVSLSTLPIFSTKIKVNDSQQQQQPLKSNRKRFKLPSLTRLTQFFNKKPTQDIQSNPVTSQRHPHRPSTGLRRLSELLY